jgi:hypothetical protein
MCSDPEDENGSCEGGTRLSSGGFLGNPKSMSVYQKRRPSMPSIDLLGKVFGLANGDMTLVGAWAQLYQTQSGYQYAMYIVNNDIRMMWGTDLDVSYSFCANGGCWVEFVPSLKPDVSDDPIYAQEKAFKLVATMGHEGYHQAYGHPGYYGDPTTDSQAEEFLAFATDYALAVELSGSGSTNKFDGYYLNDEDSLFDWINDHAEAYIFLPSYPPYIPR